MFCWACCPASRLTEASSGTTQHSFFFQEIIMFSMKYFQAAAISFATLGFGFAGTDASAGSCSSHRSHHGGSHVSAHFGGDGYRVSVRIGSGHHSDRHVTYRQSSHRHHTSRHHSRHQTHSRCETRTVQYVEYQPPTGYWTSVYRPPVYETRYDRCGNPYRVCIREGYYERVWVSTSNSCRH